MHSYEQVILNYIESSPGCTRQNVIKQFRHLSDKTIYRNIRLLISKGTVVEDEQARLSLSNKAILGSKDEWPLHSVLKDFQNLTEMTNAFANQDDIFHEKCVTLSHEYGTQLLLLLTDIMVVIAEVKGSDVHKAYKDKTAVDHKAVLMGFSQLERILQTYEQLPNSLVA
jgi:hypothetical protein